MKNKIKRFSKTGLIIYSLILIYNVFIVAYGRVNRLSMVSTDYNLVPFKTIKSYLGVFEYGFSPISFINLAGNIVAFIPLGFLLPISFDKFRNYKLITITGIAVSSVIEVVQLKFKIGYFDVDDILLNTLGVVVGFVFAKICYLVALKHVSEQ